MAQIEVKVPQLSESVAEATLLSWHKKVGEAVSRDENLIDIETDKVVLELPAPAAGVIVQIIKNDGGTVVSGEVIAIIDTEASAGASLPAIRSKTATCIGRSNSTPDCQDRVHLTCAAWDSRLGSCTQTISPLSSRSGEAILQPCGVRSCILIA